MQLPTLASGFLALAALAHAAQLSQITNFGANPSGAKMYLYVPDKLAANPPIVVAIHYCTGTAQAYFTGTPYARLADTHGFIVIYPESPYSGGCWDVSSPASLTHNGGGNSNAIANMVQWTLSQPHYAADPSRVFAVGTSSGAMMTNVLAATYPALFRAGSAYAGVPAGCFSTGTEAGWNSTCANGRSVATQDAWAATARAMGPAGYAGPRPRMRVSHGSADDVIYPQNFNETLKQWAGVFGYAYGAPREALAGVPRAGWTTHVYGENLVGVYGAGVTHDIPIDGAADMEWFGITGGGGAVTTTTRVASSTLVTLTTTTRTSSAAAVTTTAPALGGCAAARWAQCGGIGFGGCKTCVAPYTCKFSNDWYSQCL
ncbi:putative cellulose binding protein [Schizothecium vesticola]|uniref:Carboxylic ester hydrolase n=1 Tax=Schizothecium vesticola TaxID=314040 RepID=A0AA40KCV2_9PEZI|nr:putative cellulose binding protein [Schizothecium vesticola]